MAHEKVYGICGTNKCRKEVIPKENIAVLSVKCGGSFSDFNYYGANPKLPDGWTIADTHILSASYSGATGLNGAVRRAVSDDDVTIRQLELGPDPLKNKPAVNFNMKATKAFAPLGDNIIFTAVVMNCKNISE